MRFVTNCLQCFFACILLCFCIPMKHMSSYPFLLPYYLSFLNTLSQMDLKIASFNVNGLLNPTKRKAIFDYLRTILATIFLLQETHSLVQFEQAWANEWKLSQSIFHSSHENKHQSGVATLVNSMQLYMEKVSNDLNGRTLHVKIFYNSEILNITNIYAPSGKLNRTQNHRFFENLYPYIPLHHPNDPRRRF